MGRPVTMKRPEHTTAHKSEKTAEFALPDLTLIKSDFETVVPTSDLPPPVAPLQAKAVEDKQAQLTKLHRELESVKQDAVRKVDEKTQMFNLRQLELDQKAKELEDKKVKMEKELSELVKLKNSQIQEELKQATSSLLDETKKIAGLDTVVDSVQKVRLEMIRLFNQNLDERKKNHDDVVATRAEVAKMHAMVQETVGELATTYREILAASKRTLNDFESDSVKLQLAKEDLGKVALEKEHLQGQLTQLANEIQNHETKLLSVRAEMAAKSDETLSLDRKISEQQDRLHVFEETSIRLTAENSVRDEELKALRKLIQQSQVESENMKVSMDILHGTYERKAKAIAEMEHVLTSSSERTESLRQSEVQMLQVMANLEAAKTSVQAEVDALRAHKLASQEVLHEMKRLQTLQEQVFEDKKAEVAQRCKTEEERYHMELQQKTHDWELQFSEHCVSRKAQLAQELEEMSLAHGQALLQLKDNFIAEAKKSGSDVLDLKEFATREERLRAMSDVFDVAASKYVLSPLVNYSLRWKRACLAATVISCVVSGLLIWKW